MKATLHAAVAVASVCHAVGQADVPNLETSPDERVEIVEIDRTTRSIGHASLNDLSNSKGGLEQLANLRGLSAVAFFSTEPGNVAEEGDTPGKGSPFAIEFAKQIERRQSLDEVYRKTAIAVSNRTDQRQSPWRQGDLAFNVFVSGMRALPIP
ncbi:MAG: caspase family protein [Pseudomonadota bacterium]